MDVNQLNAALGRMNLGPMHIQPSVSHPPVDEFPVLGYENNGGPKARRPYQDPSRTRFAAAVKKQPAGPSSPPLHEPNLAARREAMGSSADNLHHRSAIVAPRPSPRIKLRPPTLVPTLPTGEAINQLYMTYRSRALQLGAARNACLSRAADAWRRGDGGAAKRFSREGQELNAKMSTEMATAASKLVQERSLITEQAVKSRDLNWSDDPSDRTSRGRPCGGGLGVLLGVASKDTSDGKLTSDERMECLLDLHGLHANEATEVLERFLLSVSATTLLLIRKDSSVNASWNRNISMDWVSWVQTGVDPPILITLLAFVIVGEEKHTGTQDTARGASRIRLATGIREWVHRWGYPWTERDGIICIDPLTHAAE